MDVRTEIRRDCLIVTPSGRLDGYGSGILQQVFTANVTIQINHVIFDLKDTPYISSAGIRVFLRTRNLMKDRSGTVMLCNVTEFPLNVLTMAGMDRVFPIFPDPEHALSAIPANTCTKTASPPLYEANRIDDAMIEVTPAGTGTAALQVTGSLTRVLHAGITSDDVSRIKFYNCNYSLGLGALAESPEQARHLLGEMITLHGSIVWLPTDGNYTPDFFTPVRVTGGVEIYSGFVAALQGPFHDYYSLLADTPDGISLSRIYQAIFDYSRNKRPEYSGIVAIALIGTSCGVRSSGIRYPPIPENAPADGGSIMDPAHVHDWIEVTEEPRYEGETVVAFGIGIDLKSDLSRFDPEDLSALYYIHPANQGMQAMFLHTHGVIFKHTPLPRGGDVGREIQRLLKTGEFMDMRHLMDDTRLLDARCAVSYISAIQTGN